MLDGNVFEPLWHVASPAEGTIKIWLIDTGCGHDLISRMELKDVARFAKKAAIPITFCTANGSTLATEVLPTFVKEFGEEVEPYTLAPSLLHI